MEFCFNAQIAKIAKGTDEAVFVHRVWYLTFNNEANERNFRNGKYWTYDSVAALQKVFVFWTPKQIRRIIKNCVDLGLIETGNFAENQMDRRIWYALTDRSQEIYRNGQMDLPKRANVRDQTDKCTCPNGQMIYKEAMKDTKKDLRESARDARPAPARDAYGEFGNVALSTDEYARLCGRWGETLVRDEIEELSAYMASCGKRYKNHCATLSNWLRRKYPGGISSGLEGEEWNGE